MINLILTSTAEHLAIGLKNDFKIIFPEKNKEGGRFFPDGEVYERISKVTGLKKQRVVVLHSGSPHPNDGLIELELILQILKDYGIRPELFFTYFPYGRQDKAFELGETSAAESLIKKLIGYYKVKKIYVIDPHFGKMAWASRYPITSIPSLPLLIKKAKEDFGQDILLMAPDKGEKRRTGLGGLSKKRISSFEVQFFSSKISLKGKFVGVVDDMISTGGTLVKFYDFAKKAGAKRVIALVTHGVLDSGISRINGIFNKLYFTNTIDKKGANVDITELIINALK